MDQVVEVLKQLRGDMTFEEAAQLAGVTKQAWHNWESKYNNINVGTLNKIAKAFGKELVISFR